MSTDLPNIIDAALNLPDGERAILAFQLLQSLKPVGALSEDDAQFESELHKRLSDYEAGKADAADWDQVSERLRSALDERKAP
jgi:putative addiction module component (TIGR02574 family)